MRKHLTVFLIGAVMALAAVVVWAAYSLNPYTPGGTAGTPVSGRYEGRYLTFLESTLTHPSHSDGLVDLGDVVLEGTKGIFGIALESASANTDYIAIDTEGIWNLTITNEYAMSVGDPVYMNTSTAALTDQADSSASILFGHLLSAITGANSAVVRPVKIHYHSRYVGDLVVAGDQTTSGGLSVGSGDTLYKVDLTSATIAAGASSCTLTLPTGYAVANWRVQWSVVPAIAGSAYAGHGATYFQWEGGTTAEVRISSATFINLIAEVRAERLW